MGVNMNGGASSATHHLNPAFGSLPSVAAGPPFPAVRSYPERNSRGSFPSLAAGPPFHVLRLVGLHLVLAPGRPALGTRTVLP